LQGFAAVRFPSGLEVYNIGVHLAGGRMWASPPAAARVENGVLAMDPERPNRPRYDKVIGFQTHGDRSRWSDAVLRALADAEADITLEALNAGEP
jgi:hypothetical protein